MNLRELLVLLETKEKTNYFLLAPDNLGLSLLLPKVLEKKAAREDIHYLDAAEITKEKARQLEQEARKAPVGMSDYTWFVITGLQRLPAESSGPLLKVVEESKYACFIFQAQVIPRSLRTLLSRSMLIRLPFLTKRMVLGNMQSLYYDAQLANDLGLYDGTLMGTIRAVQMKDTMLSIKRELKRGSRGLLRLLDNELLNSTAFLPAVEGYLKPEEMAWLKRVDNPERRKLLLFVLSERAAA